MLDPWFQRQEWQGVHLQKLRGVLTAHFEKLICNSGFSLFRTYLEYCKVLFARLLKIFSCCPPGFYIYSYYSGI